MHVPMPYLQVTPPGDASLNSLLWSSRCMLHTVVDLTISYISHRVWKQYTFRIRRHLDDRMGISLRCHGSTYSFRRLHRLHLQRGCQRAQQKENKASELHPFEQWPTVSCTERIMLSLKVGTNKTKVFKRKLDDKQDPMTIKKYQGLVPGTC